MRPGAVTVARDIAETVLFPQAMDVDEMEAVPRAQLDTLASAGLYGAPVTRAAGGLGLDFLNVCAVAEELAAGCLATAFVWIQHFGLLLTLTAPDTPSALRDQWLLPACRGELRGGLALAGMAPGPPLLRAVPADGGWELHGTAPWVSGWGLVDVLQVAARGPEDTLVTLIMDAAPLQGLTVTRQRLVAADASVTVRLDFTGVTVPATRVTGRTPFDPSAGLNPPGLRINGSLALGIAARCCRLIGPSRLDDELTACRARLDRCLDEDHTSMAGARAAASELAMRAAAALVVHAGSGSVTRDRHAQRLAREALFTLVFGSRPHIKADLLRRLGAAPG